MKNKIMKIISVLLCCGIILGGCSTDSTKDTEVSRGSEAEGSKILTIATASETDRLSPLYMGSFNFSTDKLVYETLCNYDNGEITTGLAQSWEFNDEGTQLTFNLQENVLFHDGEKCDAEAVKKNLEHKQSNPSYATLKAVIDIQDMEVIDENTLTITYSHPYFAYLNDFCWPDVMTMVSPNELIEGDFQTVNNIVGTGPYIFEERVSGQYSSFVKNEEYWGDEPAFDEIIVKYIPESSSRLQALETGEVDLIYGSSLISYEEYEQEITKEGIAGQIADVDTRARDMTMNASSSLLADLNVRKAVAYAINKDEISTGLTYGYEEAADLPYTTDAPYSDINLNTEFTYDPEKANELLEKAGWVLNDDTNIREKDGTTLSLVLTVDESFDSLNKSLATLIKSQLAEVGINLEIKSQEQMEWYSDYVEGKFDITFWPTQYAYASPHCFFTPMSTMTPQTASLANVSDALEFFAKIEQLTMTNDEETVQSLFTELVNYDLDNVIDIPLTYSKDMVLYNSDKIEEYTFTAVPSFFDANNVYLK
ncbi:MAG: ABC transporter substrate-binding protein [Lachnospiraceae bacterium]